MILAVLHQHCRIRLHGHDVFASTVGGARLTEPATDLALALALASAYRGQPAPNGIVAIGEIGLAGELRRVRDLDHRISEAARLGFRVAVVPSGPAPKPKSPEQWVIDGMKVIDVPDVATALRLVSLTEAG